MSLGYFPEPQKSVYVYYSSEQLVIQLVLFNSACIYFAITPLIYESVLKLNIYEKNILLYQNPFTLVFDNFKRHML